MLRALKKLHSDGNDAERSLVIVSEQYTQVLVRDHGSIRSLPQQDHLTLLTSHVEHLERLHDWSKSLGLVKRRHGVFYIFERFHLNHRHSFPDEDPAMIENLEQRLLSLNATCVLFTLSPQVVESRFIDSRGSEWASFAMKVSSSREAVCKTFLHDQDDLRRCSQLSLIPTIEVITDGAECDEYAKAILSEI
jgi:hypothetical protein